MAWESALDQLWALDREVVAAAIADVPFLAGFKNTVKSNGCTDKTLAELIVIDQGKKCIANSFKAACGNSEYEPSPNQLNDRFFDAQATSECSRICSWID